MTGTSPRHFLENQKKRERMRAIRVEVIGGSLTLKKTTTATATPMITEQRI